MTIPTALKSRKFWLTISAFISFMAYGQFTEALGVISTYLVSEGAADVVSRYQDGQYKQTEKTLELTEGYSEPIDKNTIVDGGGL